MNKKQIQRKDEIEKQDRFERETVALQALYPEVFVLKQFFETVQLYLGKKGALKESSYETLERIREGKSTTNPPLPETIADGRFDVVAHLSTELAGNYSNALARRRSVLISLSHVLDGTDALHGHGATEEDLTNMFERFDKRLERSELFRRVTRERCTEGIDACQTVIDEAERRDPALKPVPIPVHGA